MTLAENLEYYIYYLFCINMCNFVCGIFRPIDITIFFFFFFLLISPRDKMR